MKHQYLNKTGNRSLLLFFAGWGMDANPFTQLKTDYADVLIAYDYSDCNFNNLEIPQTYRNIFLLLGRLAFLPLNGGWKNRSSNRHLALPSTALFIPSTTHWESLKIFSTPRSNNYRSNRY